MSPKKIIIIGAGFGGISAAALMAKKGHDVTVIDNNEMAGGRAKLWKNKGFTFDMGPSWYLMPDVFNNFYKKIGLNPKKELKIVRLDPSYRIYFGENDKLDVRSSINRNYKLFDKLEKNGAKNLKEYLNKAKFQYDTAMNQFIYKEYETIFDFINKDILIKGAKLRVFESLDRYTKRYFVNPRSRKILEYTMVFLGGSPKNTPALYSIMSHIDFNLGVWYPIGGLGKIVEVIKTNAEKNNAKFIFRCSAKKIRIIEGKVMGVETNKGFMNADTIIVNADYHHAETKLLEERYQSYKEKYWKKRIMAPSAFMIYLGINRKIDGLKHHTLFLENDWIKHFNEIFDDPKWPDKPSYYVCCSSKTDNTVAPKGCENIFILVPIASGIKDTKNIRERYYNKTLTHLEKTLNVDIRKHIIVKRIFTLDDFRKDYNSYRGTALGLSHTLTQTAVFRPRHKSKKVKGLYYTGQYCHPGIGVPMCIISSEILCDEVIREV